MCIQHLELSFKFLKLIKLALNKIRKPFRIKWREIFCKLRTQYRKLMRTLTIFVDYGILAHIL